VAVSSAKAEYMAASLASCEAIWLHKLLAELSGQVLETTMIYYNNQSCVKLSENPLCMELGLGIVVVGVSQLLGGKNNSNLILSLEGILKLTH
jgi:hypothetical protein